MAAPVLPAPNIPKAIPCLSLGNHIEEKAIPTAKFASAISKPRLQRAKV